MSYKVVKLKCCCLGSSASGLSSLVRCWCEQLGKMEIDENSFFSSTSVRDSRAEATSRHVSKHYYFFPRCTLISTNRNSCHTIKNDFLLSPEGWRKLVQRYVALILDQVPWPGILELGQYLLCGLLVHLFHNVRKRIKGANQCATEPPARFVIALCSLVSSPSTRLIYRRDLVTQLSPSTSRVLLQSWTFHPVAIFFIRSVRVMSRGKTSNGTIPLSMLRAPGRYFRFFLRKIRSFSFNAYFSGGDFTSTTKSNFLDHI